MFYNTGKKCDYIQNFDFIFLKIFHYQLIKLGLDILIILLKQFKGTCTSNFILFYHWIGLYNFPVIVIHEHFPSKKITHTHTYT
jgi:hypothetical protein